MRLLSLAAVLLVFTGSAAHAQEEFLHSLYDRLHDSPLQRRLREEAPLPFGVVFLPWAGMTEADMRAQFRLMKKLGFHNLKQSMPSPEWPLEKILETALDEGLVPFWYGEAGWEPVTPELVARLGIDQSLSKREIREHPKMLAHQKEVLRRQIYALPKRNFLGDDEAFRHTPDPLLRPYDVPRFGAWLRRQYPALEELNRAWNLNEVGHVPAPFRAWEDVDRYLAEAARAPGTGGAWGREFGRIRDVLRYKADGRSAAVLEIVKEAHRANPLAPTRTGGEMGLFLPFAWRATRMEDLAETQREYGSFYPSVHLVWHFGEVQYEVARPLYMQASFAADLFKGGWSGAWESTGGPQQLSGSKGWGFEDGSTTPGFTVNAGTITQLYLSFLAGGFRGVGTWTWNHRRAGIEAGEYALLDRNNQPGERAIRAGQIAQAARRYREELWQAHKEPQVGVLVNWDNDAIWAALSVRNRDHFRHYPMQARVGVSRALMNGNVPWEYVTVDDLRAGLGPRYKAIYLAGQIALTAELLELLTKYAEQGGRVVLDAPGGAYDEHGKVLPTAAGSAFEKLFGAELADLQYSHNVPRMLEGERLDGFVLEVKPTRAEVSQRFQTTGEPAETANRVGKGSTAILAWDASRVCFRPGREAMEARLRRAVLAGLTPPPYTCNGAIVYRLAAPGADHYFFVNDEAAKKVILTFRSYRYRSVRDAVSGKELVLGAPVALEANSGRWLRFEKSR